MQLKPQERVWAPPEMEEIWTVVPPEWVEPMTVEKVLVLQARMAARLAAEAGEGELADADETMQESPQANQLAGEGLTAGMTLANPKTVEALLETPPAPGWQREWREKIAEAVKTPQPVTREKEALTAMASLSLATWAARVF